MKIRTKKALGLAGALTLIITSCGSGSGGDSSNPTPGGEDQPAESFEVGDCGDSSGGTLRMGLVSQPEGIDPILNQGTVATGGDELAAFYDTLMQYNSEDGTYEPHVAESLKANDAFDEWTLELRDGVTFGNGDPLDAAAVIASIERYQGDGNKSTFRTLALYIDSMEEVDDATVVFKLNRPWATFPFLLANGGGMMVNTKVAEAAGESFGTNPVGAGVGPYEFANYASGEQIELEAKDDYWAGDLCIDRLVFLAMPDDKTRWDAFRNGEIDAAYLRTPTLIAQADDAGYGSLKSLSNSNNALLLNSGAGDGTAITTDVRVRQAAGYAIDVDALDDRLNEGTGIPSKAVVADESALDVDLEPLPYDLDKAKKLIDEVKGEGSWDGSIELTCDRNREDRGLAMQAQLNAAGFDVTLDLQPTLTAIIDKVIVNQDFEMACWGFNILDSGVWATMNPQMYSTAESNYGGFESDAMDAALDDLSLAATPEEIRSDLVQIQQAWNEGMPAVPLEAIGDSTIYQDNVAGLRPNNSGIVFFDTVRITD